MIENRRLNRNEDMMRVVRGNERYGENRIKGLELCERVRNEIEKEG